MTVEQKARRRILVVAFHFPPLQLSSGLHRTLSLARYLPAHGWDVSVLTVKPKVYLRWRPQNVDLIPRDTRVIRAPALDTTRQLSIGGRYPGVLAIPDRFQSWIPFAVLAGLQECRRYKPDILLSTYPVASAHSIGSRLHKFTGIPWIADFRDPMAQADYPPDETVRRRLFRLEKTILQRARRVFVTTPGAHRLYRERYPDAGDDRITIVPNGYEESVFDTVKPNNPRDPSIIRLLHSGSLYKNERDPSRLFQALAQLRNEKPKLASRVRMMFRGTRFKDYFRNMADELHISDLVEFADGIPYEDALNEMMTADGLLVLQASNCNDQVPAKIYEYLRTGKPILAFTDPVGDTASVLRNASIKSICSLDDDTAIKSLLGQFIAGTLNHCSPPPDYDVEQHSRERIAESVSRILDQVADQR